MVRLVAHGGAYLLSIHEGLKTYKKVRDVSRSDETIHKAESLFRHGFDNLAAKVCSLEKKPVML